MATTSANLGDRTLANQRQTPTVNRASPIREPVDGREGQLLVSMSQLTAQELRNRAASKGISDSTLAAALLQKIVQDDLYEAVLDDH